MDKGADDKLQKFLNELTKCGGEIVQVIPLGNRWWTIIYKY